MIERVYEVTCDRCGRIVIVCGATSRTMCRSKLKETGWVLLGAGTEKEKTYDTDECYLADGNHIGWLPKKPRL